MATYNFGRVIDAYIAAVFPAPRRDEATAAAERQAEAPHDAQERVKEVPRRHSLLQCLQCGVLIVALVALCTYALHVHSSYLSTVALRAALKQPVAPNERGFLKLLEGVDELGNKLKAGNTADPLMVKVDLKDGSDALEYGSIRSRRDVALWMQFGLIPSLFGGLNSYNRLVGDTVRLSFVRRDYGDMSVELGSESKPADEADEVRDASVVTAMGLVGVEDGDGSDEDDIVDGGEPLADTAEDTGKKGLDVVKAVAPSDLAEEEDDEADDVVTLRDDGPTLDDAKNGGSDSAPVLKLPHASDGKHHTYSKNGGNFLYVSGDNLDAAMASLNMHCDYARSAPYFPLDAIVSDKHTSSVALEAFTSNAHDYTVSYLSVVFSFVLNKDGGINMVKTAKATSVSTPRDGATRGIQMGIFVFVVVLSFVYIGHSVHLYRRYRLYSLKMLYVLDGLGKLSLVACIVSYTARLYLGRGSGPYIQSTIYNSGNYDTVVSLGRNGRALDADMMLLSFNSLRKGVLHGYMTVGTFQGAAFCSISILFLLLCVTLCGGTKVATALRFVAFHSMLQFCLGAFGMVFALCLVSFVNAYVVNYIRSGDASFRHNFTTLANILAGVVNSQVEVYFRNESVLHTCSIVFLLFLFSFFGIYVLVTMMFAVNPEGGIGNFDPGPPSDPYDDSRFLRARFAISCTLHKLFNRNRVALLRHFAFSQGRLGVAGTAGPSQAGGAATGNSKGVSAATTLKEGFNSGCPQSSSSLSSKWESSDPSACKIPMSSGDTGGRASVVGGKSGASTQLGLKDAFLRFKSNHRNWRMLFYWLIVAGVLVFAYRDRHYHGVRRLLQQSLTDRITTSAALLPFTLREFVPKARLSPPEPPPAPPDADVSQQPKHEEDEGELEDENGTDVVQNGMKFGTVVNSGLSSDGGGEAEESGPLDDPAPPESSDAPPESSDSPPESSDAPPESSDSPSGSSDAPPGSSDASPGKAADEEKQGKTHPEDTVNRIIPWLAFQPRGIITRQDVFHWLTEGGITTLFEWTPLDNDMFHSPGGVQELLSLQGRFFAVPPGNSVYLELRLRSKDGFHCPMFAHMEKDAASQSVRHVVVSSRESVGLKELLGPGALDFPDVVERVRLEALLIDSKAQSKLYRARITFSFLKSGIVEPRVKVRSIFNIHLSSGYNNWVFATVALLSVLLFVALASWFAVDCRRYVRSYNRHHRVVSGGVRRAVAVFFMNDYLRLVDLLVLVLVGVVCALYLAIYVNSIVVYSNVKTMRALEARSRVNYALHSIRVLHQCTWVVLGAVCGLVLLSQVEMLQVLVRVLVSCLACAFVLYLFAVVALLLIVSTFLFVLLVFAAELFYELSRDEGFVVSGMRLLLGEAQLPSHLFRSRPVALLIYPVCLVLKLWLINVIFTYLWGIWPKEEPDENEEALARTREMFKCDSTEGYRLAGGPSNLTAIADDQLDLVPDDLKAYCVDEALRLNMLFRGYNEQFANSGMTKLEFVQQLQEKLGREMHEMMNACESLQLQLELARRRCELVERQEDRNLEANISLLEIALSDKKDELASVFATYKAHLEDA